MRKFEIVTKYLDSDIILPERATLASAGYDLAVATETTIEPNQIVRIPTGIKVKMNKDEVVIIASRSSTPTKWGLTIPNSIGVIDSDYYNNPNNEGEIFIQVINITNKTVTVPKNIKLFQAIFTKYLTVDDEKPVTNKRKDGFGSTTK